MPTDVFLARFVRANRGDFANQAGVMEGLRRSPLVRNVHISTFYPHHFEDYADVVPVEPAHLRGYLLNRQEKELVDQRMPIFWGGGVDLQDSGSKLKMILLLLRIWLLKRHGSKFVMAFQGAGPVSTNFGKWILKIICGQLDMAIVREPTAQKVLKESGNLEPDKNILSVDSALLLRPESPKFGESYLLNKNLDLDKPILGINLRRWFHQRGGWLPTQFYKAKSEQVSNSKMDILVAEIAKAIKSSNYYGQVVLVPMYRRHPEMWEDDIVLLERLAEQLPDDYKIVALEEDLSTSEMLSIFSHFHLMIGVRLHSTIMSHVAGVPAIHIAYEHKGIEHYENMAMGNLVLSIDSVSKSGGGDQLCSLLKIAIADRDSIAIRAIEKCEQHRNNAQCIIDETLSKLLSIEPSPGLADPELAIGGY